MNIIETLNKGSNILKKYNIKSPYLDSELLLSETIKKDRKYIILNSKMNLKMKHLNNFKNFIDRRKKGEPVAYIIKKKGFWKDFFYVDRNVLIPRPDTEIIIEEILKLYSKNSKEQILEIGTGSGCILLSLLKERPNFKGTGIDISKKSLKISKYNAKMLQLKNRVKFYNSDVDNFKIGKYDIIVSNPPYIKLTDLKYLEKEVKNFEPKLALDGGFDGFSEIRKVINEASNLIKKNGKLVLEIGFNQRNKVIEILKKMIFMLIKLLKITEKTIVVLLVQKFNL